MSRPARPRPLRRPFFAALAVGALALALPSCHRGDTVETLPLTRPLASYRVVAVQVDPTGFVAPSSQQYVAELQEHITGRLREAGLFTSVVGPTAASDLTLRASLLALHQDDALIGSGHADVRLAVDLIDNRWQTLIGRFEVADNSRSKVPSFGGGININVSFDDRVSQALARAAKRIVSYLEDQKG